MAAKLQITSSIFPSGAINTRKHTNKIYEVVKSYALQRSASILPLFSGSKVIYTALIQKHQWFAAHGHKASCSSNTALGMWGCCLCWMALSTICIFCPINGQCPKEGQGGHTSCFTDREKLGQKFQVHATPELSMMEAWVTGVMGHLLCVWSGLRHAIGLIKTLYFQHLCWINIQYSAFQYYVVVELCACVWVCIH